MRGEIVTVLLFWILWYAAFPLGLLLASVAPPRLAHEALTFLLAFAGVPRSLGTFRAAVAIFLHNSTIYWFWTTVMGVWRAGLGLEAFRLPVLAPTPLPRAKGNTFVGAITVGSMALSWSAIALSGLLLGRTTALSHALVWSLPHGALELLAYAMLAAVAVSASPSDVVRRLHKRFWVGIGLLAVSAALESFTRPL